MDKRDKQRGKNRIPIKIKNAATDLKTIEKTSRREKMRLQCKCPHTDESGKAALFRHQSETSPITGNPLFVCRVCGKYLDIYEITEQELNTAIDTIDRMTDIIKVRVNIRDDSSENDQKVYKRLWKNQEFLNGDFRDLATAARKRNKKKSGGQGGGDQRFRMNRPTT